MSTLYLVSSITLIIVFCFLKRTNSKENVIGNLLISIILYFCYTSFIVFILSIFNIRATVIFRTVFNCILIGVILFLILKKGFRQQVYFSIMDFLAVIVFFVVGGLIYYIRFKNGGVYFETTDPAVHFAVAERFYNDSMLSMDTPLELFYDGSTFDLFSSYVSLGTVFQFFSRNSQVFHLKIFVYFETAILIMSALAIYFGVIKERTKIYKKLIVIAFISLYLFGYPFSNFIFGFHYLGMSILLISVIFKVFLEGNEQRKITVTEYGVLFLLNFTVFTLYYLFVPIVYGAEGGCIIYSCIFRKKYNCKECIRRIVLTLVIPFIIGFFIYFIYPYFIGTTNSGGMSAFKLEGYIYRNLLGNFILLIPGVIYSIIKWGREKKVNVIHFATILCILFMVFLFINVYMENAATYYYFKFYYILSMLCYFMIAYDVAEDNNMFTNILAIYISLLTILQLYGIEGKVAQKVFLLNPTNSIAYINATLQYNQEIITIREPIFSKEQLKDIDNIINENADMLHTGNVVSSLDLLKNLWIYSMYEISVAQDPYTLGSYYEDFSLERVLDSQPFCYLITTKEDYDNIYSMNEIFSVVSMKESFCLLEIKR